MSRITMWLHEKEWRLFSFINHSCHHKSLNLIFGTVTHLGGATATISLMLFVILFFPAPYRFWGVESLVALTISHLFVVFIKKRYQRRRPYITYPETRTPTKILTDHSFPSGHTTAIFSVITPFVYHLPQIAIYLVVLASIVGLSRIYIGLHYPSDVMAGALLGSGIAMATVFFQIPIFPN